MKKFVKKYWAIIVGAIVAFVGILIASNKKSNEKQLDNLDKQIDDNKQQVDIITGKVEAIEDQKQDIKTDIVDLKETVDTLQNDKKQIKPKQPKNVSTAKQNILNKTKKPKTKKS